MAPEIESAYAVHLRQLLSKYLFGNVEDVRVGRPMRRRRGLVLGRRVVERVGHDEGRRVGVAGVDHRRRRLEDERRWPVRRAHSRPDAGRGTVRLEWIK